MESNNDFVFPWKKYIQVSKEWYEFEVKKIGTPPVDPSSKEIPDSDQDIEELKRLLKKLGLPPKE